MVNTGGEEGADFGEGFHDVDGCQRLGEDLVTALDLEQSYEQACGDLWIS